MLSADHDRAPLVRLATMDDAADVTRLMVAFRNWWQRDTPDDQAFAAGCRRLLASPDTEFLLAVREGQRPFGVAQLRYRYSVWQNASSCLLEDLYVDDSARRLGAGQRLVEAAIERAEWHGCGRIELDVNDANEAAYALYTGLGFSAWSDPPGGIDLMLRRSLKPSAVIGP